MVVKKVSYLTAGLFYFGALFSFILIIAIRKEEYIRMCITRRRESKNVDIHAMFILAAFYCPSWMPWMYH